MALAQAEVELADPRTPLGKAQAAALRPPRPKARRTARPSAPPQAAKQFTGVTLNMTYEAGLQALDPRNFSGPMWEQLTGIKTNVVELSYPDQYSKPVAEHIAGSGAYDMLDIAPAWTPVARRRRRHPPLDDYIAKYMNKADLDDYHPLYKALPTYKGKIWGFFDDGDMFALYYRKDIFEDPKLKEAYQAKFGKPLEAPKTWEDYIQVAQFITDNLAPNVYGAGHFRKAGSPGNQFDFLQQFRANGGSSSTTNMKAQLASDAGVKTLQNMIAANNASIPGNNELDAVSLWAAWLQGKVAMIYSWPPTGRMSAGYSQTRQGDQLRPAVADRGQGRLCRRARQSRSTPPATTRRCARIRPTRTPPICSCNGRPRRRSRWRACMLPYALRDPVPPVALHVGALRRRSGPTRRNICVNLNNSANVGLLDPIMPGAQDYFLVDRPDVRPRSGPAPTRRRRWRPRRRSGTRPPTGSASTSQKALLHRVPEAARLDRRQHRGEARHGREPRADEPAQPAGARHPRRPATSFEREQAMPDAVPSRSARPRDAAHALLGARRSGPTAISSGCWSRRRCCSSSRCRSIRCCSRSGSPSSITTSRSPATPSSA